MFSNPSESPIARPTKVPKNRLRVAAVLEVEPRPSCEVKLGPTASTTV